MSRFTISRRSALAAMGGAAALSLAGQRARAAGEIKVLNWQGYGTDEKWALEMFEKQTGTKVVHDYFNSEQEMLTKLRTSPGAYDVVLVNNIYVMDAANEGLIQAIDTSKIANFADLAPALRDSDRFVKDGKHYAISWVWGLTSFAYNTEKIKERPDSMMALWDAKYAGKVGMRDDALEADPDCRAGDRSGHEQPGRHGQGEGRAAGAEAADRHLLVVGRRVEQAYRRRRL